MAKYILLGPKEAGVAAFATQFEIKTSLSCLSYWEVQDPLEQECPAPPRIVWVFPAAQAAPGNALQLVLGTAMHCSEYWALHALQCVVGTARTAMCSRHCTHCNEYWVLGTACTVMGSAHTLS
jgi:hypothetical protein